MESTEERETKANLTAQALGLTVQPEWKPAVRANLEVTFRLAGVVAETALPDDAEPAPVFRA